MSSFFAQLGEEEGSAMVIALLMLGLLTILGLAAATSTEVALQIARNDRVYKENVYRAESAAMMAAQALANETDATALRDMTDAWVFSPSDMGNPDDILDGANWTDAQTEEGLDANNRYFAVRTGVASGSSLGTESSRVYEYALYGRSDARGGVSVVQLGFKMRY